MMSQLQYFSIGSDNGMHRPGDKSLSEPMMVRLATHICVTRPALINWYLASEWYCSQNVLFLSGQTVFFEQMSACMTDA